MKLIDCPFKINYYESDSYYILNLDRLYLNKKLKNIIKRAEKEVVVKITKTFKNVHKKLIRKFCKRKKIGDIYIRMYSKIPDYIRFSKTAYLIKAWRDRELIAFTIYEDAPKKYGFYLFNFTENKNKYVPGTSDLLFKNVLKLQWIAVRNILIWDWG